MTRKAAGPVGTGGSTAWTNLLSIAVPAGALAVGSVMKIHAALDVFGSAAARGVGLYVANAAGNVISTDLGDTVAGVMTVEATLHVIDTATVYVSADFRRLLANAYVMRGYSYAFNATNAFTIYLQGITVNAGDEITGSYLTTVEAK